MCVVEKQVEDYVDTSGLTHRKHSLIVEWQTRWEDSLRTPYMRGLHIDCTQNKGGGPSSVHSTFFPRHHPYPKQ